MLISDKKRFSIGVVVIGRNEGQRLVTCLDSFEKQVDHIVYVDSSSTDNSVQEARNRNVDNISLDLSRPFTAARARNEGAKYLVDHYPEIAFIQFIDGDCEIQSDWIDNAYTFLVDNEAYAVACGRRRERFPEESIYNQLCDIEWNTPIGDALACGGDALFRLTAFQQVAGYNDSLIAGEEPELCFRLREKGWKIRRLDAEMTLHDAAIIKLDQWWSRATRAGYAYASSSYLHGATKEYFKVKEIISIIVWASLLPILIILLSLFYIGSLVLLVIYPLQIFRLAIKAMALNKGWKIAFFYALSTIIAKFPQFAGIIKFVKNKLQGINGRLIEYK